MLSHQNPRVIVDLRTARAANLILKKSIAAEKLEEAKADQEKKRETGLGFSVLSIGASTGNHTGKETGKETGGNLAVQFL